MLFRHSLLGLVLCLTVAPLSVAQLVPVIAEPAEKLVSNNSVARLSDGRILLAVPPGRLLISRTPRPITINDFEEALALPDEGQISIAVADETVHLLSAAGKRLRWLTSAAPITPEAHWEEHSVELDGDVQLQGLVRDSSGSIVAVYTQTIQPADSAPRWRVGVVAGAAQEVHPRTIAESDQPISSVRAACGADDMLEIVWTESEHAPQIRRARSSASGDMRGEAERLGDGRHADVLWVAGRTFIASETPDGAIRVEWRDGDKLAGTQRLDGLALYRPVLTTDQHGVVWLFAAGRQQRGLFYRRFLGDAAGFGAEYQCAGSPGAWRSSTAFSVQPPSARGHGGLAILRGEYSPENEYRYCFENLPVPTYAVTDARRVLFLDLLEVAEMENLDHRTATAVRSDANPLDLNGPPGSADEAWINYPNVLYDQGKFRMWYSTNTNTHERNMNIAYAESDDGLRWRKPELGLVEYSGSKKNNLLFPRLAGEGPPDGYNAAVSLVVRDDQERDPQRRYKMVFESGYEGGTSVYLTWSPDGIHWQVPPHRLWGKAAGRNKTVRGFHPWHEPLSSFFYDPITDNPEYRWKIYGQDAYAGYPHFDSDRRRNLCVVHGPTPYDFYPYPGNSVLDARTGHDEDQIHGGLVQPYQGMYVCLYQHWSGPDWKVDLRLAASRDGLHFARIHPEQAILPLGAPGQWDSGMLCTPSSFIVHDGQIWLYYRGSVGTLATGRALSQLARDLPHLQKLGEAWRMMAGLARLREDGFAFLTVAPMRQLTQPRDFNEVPKYHQPLSGRVQTIPIDAAGIGGRTLHVNLQNFAPGFAHLKAQLRDADSDQVIAGYSFADCDAMTQPSLDARVTWNGSPDLAQVQAKQIRLEFELFGTLDAPQLYSFWFAPAAGR